VHSEARSATDTDWSQILANYDHLLTLNPSPVVALNRAVALAEVEGPAAGLVEVEGLDLDGYHLYHATRADLLVRLGRPEEAATAYDRALEVVTNETERRFLESRRATLA
jgi:RNA polymerase sigma-70 factor (ECF subfamily)